MHAYVIFDEITNVLLYPLCIVLIESDTYISDVAISHAVANDQSTFQHVQCMEGYTSSCIH